MFQTGFSFLDHLPNGISNNAFVTIKGERNNEFLIDLMQRVLETHQQDYVLVFNIANFSQFRVNIFNGITLQQELLLNKLSKDRILSRMMPLLKADELQASLPLWLKMKKFNQLQDKRLAAVFTTYQTVGSTKQTEIWAKELAESLSIPVFLGIYPEQKTPSNSDMLIKLNENGTLLNNQLISVSIYKKENGKNICLCKNKPALNYTNNLADCKHLWFEENL